MYILKLLVIYVGCKLFFDFKTQYMYNRKVHGSNIIGCFSWLNNLHRKLIHGGRELEQGKFTTDTLRQHRQYSILQGNVEPFLLVLVYISWIKIKIAQEHIQLSFYLVYKCICIITETRERNVVDHSLIKVWV